MDVLKDLAEKFSQRENLMRYHYSLERFDSELSDVFFTIRNEKEQLRFIGYLRDVYETDYQEHIKQCKEPQTCSKHRSYEIALYCINQAFDELGKELGSISALEKPAMQYFAQGQYFDAYSALRECVKPAIRSIILVDGYVNDDTLAFFPTKEPNFKFRILTKEKSINDSFNLATKNYNKQYQNIKVSTSEKFHDRFLIIDETDFYHIGASIKDAGNKIFMFTKIEDESIHALIIDSIKHEWNEILL